MPHTLNVLYVSPEVVPFAKTGGLADVAGALPRALADRGHRVTVMMPRYRSLYNGEYPLANDATGSVDVPVGDRSESATFYTLEKENVRYVFVSHDDYFNRPELYRDPSTGTDWADNDERFVFFSRAVLEWCLASNVRPDIINVNDWQSALIAVYLRTIHQDDLHFSPTRVILTIHNLAYHGQFPAERFSLLGYPAEWFMSLSPFEFYGKVNFLKAGIFYADKINTVSRTYAQEIQTGPDLGCGLDGLLRDRAPDLYGIVNGIDYDIWNPATDHLIPAQYTPEDLAGKQRNKAALLEKCGFAADKAELPLMGMISRLDAQKGFDLIEKVADELFSRDLLFVLLGTGTPKYHTLFETLQAKYGDTFRPFLTFDNQLAHLIEAGSDMFLMPSRYEPCGLNQLYSLKYGTVPVVRSTGGLADTVIDIDSDTNGTGITFRPYTPEALLQAIDRAVSAYSDKKRWNAIVQNGMRQDFSWASSAKKYERLYQAAIADR